MWKYDYAPIKGYEDTHPVNQLLYTRDELAEIIRKAYNASAGFTFQACAGDVVDELIKINALKVRTHD